MVKRQKLYVKIYLAVLASIAIFAVATALLWHTLDDREERTGGRFDAMMQLVQNAMTSSVMTERRVRRRSVGVSRAHLVVRC